MGIDWGSILTQFFLIVITLAVPPLVTALMIYIQGQNELRKSRMDSETLANYERQLGIVKKLAREFVYAAEQSGLSGQIKNIGAEKKDLVLAQLESELERRGIQMDLHVLSNAVEAAVFEGFTQWKEQSQAVPEPAPEELPAPEEGQA